MNQEIKDKLKEIEKAMDKAIENLPLFSTSTLTPKVVERLRGDTLEMLSRMCYEKKINCYQMNKFKLAEDGTSLDTDIVFVPNAPLEYITFDVILSK